MELSSKKEKEKRTLIKKILKKLKLDTHFLKSSMIIFALHFTIIWAVIILAFVCVGLSSYTTNEHLKRLFSRFGVVTEGMLCVQVTDFFVFSFCV